MLPPTPLGQHLVALHALLLHLGADGDVRAVAEHHLREIGVFTQVDPLRYPPGGCPAGYDRDCDWWPAGGGTEKCSMCHRSRVVISPGTRGDR